MRRILGLLATVTLVGTCAVCASVNRGPTVRPAVEALEKRSAFKPDDVVERINSRIADVLIHDAEATKDVYSAKEIETAHLLRICTVIVYGQLLFEQLSADEQELVQDLAKAMLKASLEENTEL